MTKATKKNTEAIDDEKKQSAIDFAQKLLEI